MADGPILARFPTDDGDVLVHPDVIVLPGERRIEVDEVQGVEPRGQELVIRRGGGESIGVRLRSEADAADAEQVITTLLSEATGDEDVTEGLEGSFGGALGPGSPPETGD